MNPLGLQLILNEPENRILVNTIIGRHEYTNMPISADEFSQLMNTPFGGVIKERYEADVVISHVHQLYNELIALESGLIQAAEAQANQLTDAKVQHRKVVSLSEYREHVRQSKRGTRSLSTLYQELVTELNALYKQVETLSNELKSLRAERIEAQKSYHTLIVKQHTQLIEFVKTKGQALSKPQAAQLEMLTSQQLRHLPQAHIILSPDSKQPISAAEQINFMTEILGEQAPPSARLALIRVTRMSSNQLLELRSLLTEHANDRVQQETSLSDLTEQEQKTAHQLMETIKILKQAEAQAKGMVSQLESKHIAYDQYTSLFDSDKVSSENKEMLSGNHEDDPKAGL